MYEMQDKARLYWLIDQYLSGKIQAWDFCSKYHESYDLETDLDSLTALESKVFSELSDVAGRFSDIEEDLNKYPGTYFNAKQLMQKVVETKKILSQKS